MEDQTEIDGWIQRHLEPSQQPGPDDGLDDKHSMSDHTEIDGQDKEYLGPSQQPGPDDLLDMNHFDLDHWIRYRNRSATEEEASAALEKCYFDMHDTQDLLERNRTSLLPSQLERIADCDMRKKAHFFSFRHLVSHQRRPDSPSPEAMQCVRAKLADTISSIDKEKHTIIMERGLPAKVQNARNVSGATGSYHLDNDTSTSASKLREQANQLREVSQTTASVATALDEMASRGSLTEAARPSSSHE